jgi:GDP-4-dehydro-6-deoxy-D-mannose reductase
VNKKYLITGHSGFVGRYLIGHILKREPDADILGLDLHDSGIPRIREKAVNLLQKDDVQNIVRDFGPDFLIHLASFSSVAFSWSNPIDSFANNTNIFLTLLEAVRGGFPECRILSIGSSEEYGIVGKDEIPLTEESPLRPASPYAVARVAQEHLSSVYTRGYGLHIVCTRSFNHIGPGQTDQFFVSSMVKKFVQFQKGIIPELTVGNLDVVRDFLDVRDVVVAYYDLLQRGAKGEVYNICSGEGILLSDFVELIKKVTGVSPPIVGDNSLKRPVENRIVVGSNSKITARTGWKRTYTLEQSISDIYNHYLGILH